MKQTETPISDPSHEVARIEELIRDLAGESSTPNGLVRENLEAARYYLLGSMPREYRMSLKLASSHLPDLPDKNLQSRVAEFLHSQETHTG